MIGGLPLMENTDDLISLFQIQINIISELKITRMKKKANSTLNNLQIPPPPNPL